MQLVIYQQPELRVGSLSDSQSSVRRILSRPDYTEDPDVGRCGWMEVLFCC